MRAILALLTIAFLLAFASRGRGEFDSSAAATSASLQDNKRSPRKVLSGFSYDFVLLRTLTFPDLVDWP
jgi:hypothetical protein